MPHTIWMVGPTPTPPWPVTYAPILSALAVVVVGTIAATIAWRQWRTAQSKLQLELYDKRYPTFLAARQLIQDALANVQIEDIVKFDLAVAEAPFLFGPEMVQYLQELRIQALATHTLANQIRRPPATAHTARLADQHMDKLNWFLEAHHGLTGAFETWLRLEQRNKGRAGKPWWTIRLGR